MTNSSQTLETGRPLLFLLFFTISIGTLFLVLSSISNYRKEKIYNTYAQETEIYIAKNQQGLEILFNNLMKDECLTDEPWVEQCSVTSGGQIAQLITDDLQDWSSIMFIKRSSTRIHQMRLSGDISRGYFYPRERENEVSDLLNGKADKIPWDDYTNLFPGKEVIIAVKGSSGNVLGAIVRGVIEK